MNATRRGIRATWIGPTGRVRRSRRKSGNTSSFWSVPRRPMQGKDFLALAREIFAGATERHWRGAAGRAYYALLLEGREALFRWGFALPPRDNVHSFVRLRFSFAADADMKAIGKALDKLSRLRNQADYDLSALPAF